MRISRLRHRIAVAGSIGAAALIATVGIAGVAGANTYNPGTNPANGVVDPAAGYPLFNNGVVNADRSVGSDTTFFMMQKIGDLYTQAALYGCPLNVGAETDTLYNGDLNTTNSGVSGPIPANGACLSGGGATTTDNDNWSRTEISNGVDLVGSGSGQNQICGAAATPIPAQFGRSSKPASTTITNCTLGEAGYAKDGVNSVEFQISPANLPTGSGTVPAATTAPYSTINNGSLGDVALGWLPGDATTTTGNSTGTGAASGTPFTLMQNGIATPGTAPIGAGHDNPGSLTTTATIPFRLYCATSLTGTNPRINDWGVLTNLGPNLAVANVTLNGTTTATTSFPLPSSLPAIGAGFPLSDLSTSGNLPSGETVTAITPNLVSGVVVNDTLTLSNGSGVGNSGTNGDNLRMVIGTQLTAGSGAADGIPVNIQGVNSGSGTYATFSSYVASSAACANANANALHSRQLLENNASQVADLAKGDFPSDLGAQADEIATSLYFVSNGVSNSTPYAGAICFPDLTNAQGCDTASGGFVYSTTPISLNGWNQSPKGILNNFYPTSRTLFNVYVEAGSTATGAAIIPGSAAGFLNWICDSNNNFQKGRDNSTGVNFDTELGSLIGSFGFQRLTDLSKAPSANGGSTTPADKITGGGDNMTCATGSTGSGATAVANGLPPVLASQVGNLDK